MNIGVFDSGVGGLWILKHLQRELPSYNYIFVGDQYHAPYGVRKMEEIKSFSENITQFLIEKDCKIIVIACNTASAASLKYLREKFPDIFFVGMEPAVKPAVMTTHTGKVGVLATKATFQGELYNSVVERFAHDTEIFTSTCEGLVSQIEKGDLDGLKTKNILQEALLPMLEKGIDTVVLGCTHYPFVIEAIRDIVGNDVNIIDPTNAIVRRVGNILRENNFNNLSHNIGSVEIFTSGSKENMTPILDSFLNINFKLSEIKWNSDLSLNMVE